MQGKGQAALDPKPRPSVNMANLTRLSVLIAEPNVERSRETAALLQQLGVQHIVRVDTRATLLESLGKQAFDVLMCAERLGDGDGVSALREARNAAPATRAVLMRANERAGEHVPADILPTDIEAIELPFSVSTLQGLLHRTAAPQGGLWCEVPELSLSDILQMYHQARRSITVLLSGPIAGRIRLEAGEIVDAEAHEEHGMPALSRLLEAESGLVRTEPPCSSVRHTISAPFQSVLLEAAQKLDERRRDSLASPAISSPVMSASSGAPSSGQGAVGNDFLDRDLLGDDSSAHGLGSAGLVRADPGRGDPVDDWVAQDLGRRERPSASGDAARRARTPMLRAHAPHPESHLIPPPVRRRRAVLATIGVLTALVFVAVAASYLGRRLGERQALPAPGANDPSLPQPRVAQNEAPPALAFPRSADDPGNDRGAGQAKDEAHLGDRDVSSAPAARQLPAPNARPAGSDELEPPAPMKASSFALHITSRPSRATVFEAGRMLGKTPLTVTIGASSVADSPREFVLRLPGHAPSRIYQGASSADVSAKAVLVPRPAATEVADGGAAATELDGTGPRPGSPRPRQKDLGIRLRR